MSETETAPAPDPDFPAAVDPASVAAVDGRTSDADASNGAERVFSKSVVVSGIRCTLTYVIFPFVAPLVGVTADVGAVIGVAIGVVAIVFNVLSIRRFFLADHRYKWWASAMNVAVIVLLVILFVVDSQTLLG